ncbi:MAG: hypothetical protein ABIL20_07160, partial [candidate division WOR-3 bacterium]
APIILILFIIFKKKILDVLIIITATVIPALPWLITAQQLPGLYAEHYLSYVPEFFQYLHRIPMIVKTALLEVVNIKHWGIFWLFSLFVLIYSRPKREVGYFSLAVGTLMFFYLGIFLVTPWDVEFQMKVVFPRMLLHIIPATLFLVARQFFWN